MNIRTSDTLWGAAAIAAGKQLSVCEYGVGLDDLPNDAAVATSVFDFPVDEDKGFAAIYRVAVLPSLTNVSIRVYNAAAKAKLSDTFKKDVLLVEKSKAFMEADSEDKFISLGEELMEDETLSPSRMELVAKDAENDSSVCIQLILGEIAAKIGEVFPAHCIIAAGSKNVGGHKHVATRQKIIEAIDPAYARKSTRP